MNGNAVNAVIERVNPVLTLGDVVAAVSEVAEEDSAELLSALFASRRDRFLDPGALDRLANLSRPLDSGRRSAPARHARTRSASRRRASGAN